MTEMQLKLHALREWRYQEERTPLPAWLLPVYNDMEAFRAGESPAIIYLCELIGDMAGEIERLQKLMEGKTSCDGIYPIEQTREQEN